MHRRRDNIGYNKSELQPKLNRIGIFGMPIRTIDIDLSELKNSLAKARDEALVVKHRSPGQLILKGTTSLDLLHRMSTNELLQMTSATIRESILTTAHARIIDRISVLRRSEDLMVLTSPEQEGVVGNWLRQHTFFQDDVQITSMDSSWSRWGIYGPKASEVTRSNLPNIQLPIANAISAGEGAIVWHVESPTQGVNILLDPQQAETMEFSTLAELDLTTAQHAYEILRIKAGIPKSPNEINENYIPLELGLWDAVSFSKGCYIGQEIIARMESRGKLARKLVGLQVNVRVPVGSSIYFDKRNLGVLTSITFSPIDGWIGLGVIKSIPEDAAEDTITIGTDRIEGKIVEFSKV